MQSVIGPSQVVEARSNRCARASRRLLASNEKVGPLATSTASAATSAASPAASARLRDGLSQATSGAGLLAEGSGKAEEGAIAIADGPRPGASAAAKEAVDAIDKFAKGTKELAKAQNRAAIGALQLKFGCHDLIPNLSANGLRRREACRSR